MKKISKLLGIVLIIALVMSLSVSAFAASIEITHDEKYETNVDPTSPARVYLAYKIFDASYENLAGENTQADKDAFTYTPDDAAVAYSMASDSPWLSVMQASGQTWFDVKQAGDGSYVVTPKKDASNNSLYSTTEHAQAFAAYLAENIPATATSTEVTVDAAAVTVDSGYYLIVAKDTADAVTRIALITTDVEMVEKNTYVSVHKTTAQTSYKVGDKVEYTATVDIPSDTALTQKDGDNYVAGHGPIILHDKMDSRLTFQGTMKSATVDGAAFTGYTLTWTEDTSAVNHTTAQTDGCTFEVVIPVTSALLGKTITFTYEAEVNSSAATDEGLVNEMGGEINNYKTVPEKPIVYTFDFGFKKLFDGSTDSSLTATFVLQDENGTEIVLTKISDTLYSVKDSDDTAVTNNLITITNGQQITIKGLKAGTYKLVEKSTDTGYNLLDGPVTVEIEDTTKWGNGVIVGDPSHKVTVDGEELAEGVYVFDVTNYSGTVLPSTGGIGTTIFYVVGSILVVAAGVLLITKKRMSKEG